MASGAGLQSSREIPPKPMIKIERNGYSFFAKEDIDPQACWEAKKRQEAKVAVPPQNFPLQRNSMAPLPLLPHQTIRPQPSGGSRSSKSSAASSSMYQPSGGSRSSKSSAASSSMYQPSGGSMSFESSGRSSSMHLPSGGSMASKSSVASSSMYLLSGGSESSRSSTPSSSVHNYQQYPTQENKDAHISSWISSTIPGMSRMEEDKGYKNDINQNQTPEPGASTGTIKGQDIHVHYAHLGSYMRDSFQNGKICDICFQVGDEIIPLHQVVLACHSPYFAEIFETEEFNLLPRKPKQVLIRGASAKAVKLFLEYIYSGNIALSTAEIPDIMLLAKIFRVEELRKFCCKRVKQLNNEELLKLLPVLKSAVDIEFCDHIMKILAKRFISATQCDAFFELDIDTLCMVLSCDALNVKSEMDVFCAGVAWMNHHNTEKRAQHLEKIMECIRFPLMSSKELLSCYKKCPMLRGSPYCMEMITLANWVQTCVSMNEKDPLDIDVPNQRNSVNSSASVSSYLSRNSSSDNECSNRDIEVEVSIMPEDMASDFNTHAYMHSVSSSTISDKCVVHQYRKSKSKETGPEENIHAQKQKARMQHEVDQRKEEDALLRRAAKEKVLRKQDALNSREKATRRDLEIAAGEKHRTQHKQKNAEQAQEKISQPTNSDKEKKKSMIWDGRQWYMIGGARYKGKEKIPYPKKEVLVYNYETKRWKSLAPLNEARMQHTLCIENGHIYAIGGIGEGNRLLNSAECYDTRHNRWYFVKTLT